MLTLERGEGSKREEENHGCARHIDEYWFVASVASCMCPDCDQTHNLGVCLELGISSTTLQFMGGRSNQLGHAGQGCPGFVLKKERLWVVWGMGRRGEIIVLFWPFSLDSCLIPTSTHWLKFLPSLEELPNPAFIPVSRLDSQFHLYDSDGIAHATAGSDLDLSSST